MTLTPESLPILSPALAGLLHSETRFCVAYSGGCDSHVLLHLLAGLLGKRGELPRLRAIHVDHTLQAESGQWARHCRRTCRHLGVPLRVSKLCGDDIRKAAQARGSLENAAREARYGVFENLLGKGEVLLQAHHADDQLETMLFRLARGSGLQGLTGIPEQRELGRGRVLRPLLGVSRQAIEDYARHHSLEWVDDPSNRSLDFDRNFLRAEILPLLKQRWPGLQQGFLRSRSLLQDAEACSRALAKLDLEAAGWAGNYCLAIEPLLSLPVPRRNSAVRHWLSGLCGSRGVPPPDYVSLQRICNEVMPAAPSANPVVRWPKGRPQTEIRRYDGRLYCLPLLPAIPSTQSWNGRTPLLIGDGLGTLELRRTRNGFDWDGGPLEVRFDQRGVRVEEPGRPTRSLGRWCQQRRLPPWVRQRLPLVYCRNELVSIGDLLVPASQQVGTGREGWSIRWIGADLDCGAQGIQLDCNSITEA